MSKLLLVSTAYRSAVFINVACRRCGLVRCINQILPAFAVVSGRLGRESLSIAAAGPDTLFVLDAP
jgi:hypothetical protein